MGDTTSASSASRTSPCGTDGLVSAPPRRRSSSRLSKHRATEFAEEALCCWHGVAHVETELMRSAEIYETTAVYLLPVCRFVALPFSGCFGAIVARFLPTLATDPSSPHATVSLDCKITTAVHRP